jgi:CheY-like chemotaxis protein
MPMHGAVQADLESRDGRQPLFLSSGEGQMTTDGAAVKRVLVLDDLVPVREKMKEFLQPEGYLVRGVGTAAELLRALKEEQYGAAILDIELDQNETIGETYRLYQNLFPGLEFPHQAVLRELYQAPDAPVSGSYLLPMIKTVSPGIGVIMMTGTWARIEDEHFFGKWGSFIVQKAAEADEFAKAGTLSGLDKELIRFLREIFAAKDGTRGLS